jgi:hypothetical protein
MGRSGVIRGHQILERGVQEHLLLLAIFSSHGVSTDMDAKNNS